MIKADLHIHSICSDGKLSLKQIVDLSIKNNIHIISITDHDSIDISEELSEYSGNSDISIIPGIELSADYYGREIHILGYFINIHNKALIEHLKLIKQLRTKRFEKIIDKLYSLGVTIDGESLIKELTYNCSLGRPHIANELVKKGFVKDFSSAFTKYLGDYKPAFEKKDNLNFKVIIELIKISGGLSFIAHPSSYFRVSSLVELKKEGINGIEVHHPSHTANQTDKYSKFASENNLLVCGGSDFHGFDKIDYVNFGKYFVTDNEVNIMKSKI